MHKLNILVSQSLKNKMCKRSFILYTLMIYFIIIFISCLPLLLMNFNKSSVIDVEIYSQNYELASTFEQMLEADGVTFTSTYNFVVEENPVLPSELKNSEYDAIISLDDMTIYTKDSTTISDTDALIITSIYQGVYQQILVEKYDVSSDYIAELSAMPMFKTETIQIEGEAPTKENNNAYIIHFIVMIPLFILIMVITQIVSMEISEEKTSRAMEIMLSSITSRAHMVSKIISGVIFMIVQIITMVLGLITGLIINIHFIDKNQNSDVDYINQIIENVKSVLFSQEFILYISFVLILLIITVITYVIIIATVTSTVTSIEDVSKIQTPVMLVMVAGFYYMIFATQFPNLEPLSIFLGLIPLFNVMLAPLLYITGVVSATYLLISTIIGLIFMVCVFFIVQKPYKFGLLNYSNQGSYKILKNAFFLSKDK